MHQSFEIDQFARLACPPRVSERHRPCRQHQSLPRVPAEEVCAERQRLTAAAFGGQQRGEIGNRPGVVGVGPHRRRERGKGMRCLAQLLAGKSEVNQRHIVRAGRQGRLKHRNCIGIPLKTAQDCAAGDQRLLPARRDRQRRVALHQCLVAATRLNERIRQVAAHLQVVRRQRQCPAVTVDRRLEMSPELQQRSQVCEGLPRVRVPGQRFAKRGLCQLQVAGSEVTQPELGRGLRIVVGCLDCPAQQAQGVVEVPGIAGQNPPQAQRLGMRRLGAQDDSVLLVGLARAPGPV